MPPARSLWTSSAAWRWTVVLTLLATALAILPVLWKPSQHIALAPASYHPPAKPLSIGVTPVGPGSMPRIAGAPRGSTTSAATNPSPQQFPPGTELQAIGVYKGAAPTRQTDQPWWAKCTPKTGKPLDPTECHRKYAGQRTPRTITVSVSRTGVPMVLALMAYEPVNWNLALSPSVDIRKIIIAGYHGQDITGIPDTVPVDVLTSKSSPCTHCSRHSGSFYAYDQDSPEYSRAQTRLKALTGLRISAFQGSYQADRFSISGVATVTRQTLSAAPAADRYTGKDFELQLTFAGMAVPLPEGSWRGIAFARPGSKRGRDELLVLARIDAHQVQGMIAIRAQVSTDQQGFPTPASCTKTDIHAHAVEKNSASGKQLCSWVNHSSQPWSEPIFSLAASQLRSLGVQVPGTLLNAGFHKAGKDAALTVYYFVNPETQGISTPVTSWAASPWHPRRIKAFPDRQAFVQDYIKWSKSWLPIFKAASPQ